VRVEFTARAWNEFSYWVDHDVHMVARIRDLLKSIRETPFKGIGKPEPLKHNLKGFWSRRISDEHHLVYRISDVKGADQTCSVIQCRFHYDE
jgi:toxin YoeB